MSKINSVIEILNYSTSMGQLPPPEVGGLHPNKTQRGQVPILVR